MYVCMKKKYIYIREEKRRKRKKIAILRKKNPGVNKSGFRGNTGINKSGFREMLHLASNIKNVFTRNR